MPEGVIQMSERECGENIGQMIAIVEHCRGKSMRFVKFGLTVADLSEKYQLMANDHDKLVHGSNDPCKKQFTLTGI